MKRLTLFVIACLAVTAAQAQTAPAAAPAKTADDPVVAVIEGREWKKSDLERMVRALGPNIARQYYNNKRAFLTTYGLMVKLSAMAEEEQLDKQDPHIWKLDYNRRLYLASARADIQNVKSIIYPADQQKYYEEHKTDFSKAKVKVIYLSFNDNPMKSDDPKAKKPRTGAETEKLAADLVKQLRAGADFAKLAKEYSDDADSKSKDGDFPPIKPTDNSLPPQVKSVIFALKPGAVSDPLRQAGGFWIFRMEEFVTSPYDEVKDDIYKLIQEAQFGKWMEGIQKSVAVEFKDDKYLDDKAPAK